MIKQFLQNALGWFYYFRIKKRPERRRCRELKKWRSVLKLIQRAKRRRNYKKLARAQLLGRETITTIAHMYGWNLRQKLLAKPRYNEEKRLPRFGFKGYSQNEEDGILQEIFSRIGTTNKYFFEIGSADGLENNTLYLLIQGWHGFWVEGNPKNVDSVKHKFKVPIKNGSLRVKCDWVQKNNINQLMAEGQLDSGDLDLFSLDIDGNDYHILEAIERLSSRVLVIEYNPKYRPGIKWVMEYNPKHSYDLSDQFGASLKSFEILLSKKGYKLVGCNLLGSNAFFVREDLMGDHFLSDCSAENHYEPERHFLKDGLVPLHSANFGSFQIK